MPTCGGLIDAATAPELSSSASRASRNVLTETWPPKSSTSRSSPPGRLTEEDPVFGRLINSPPAHATSSRWLGRSQARPRGSAQTDSSDVTVIVLRSMVATWPLPRRATCNWPSSSSTDRHGRLPLGRRTSPKSRPSARLTRVTTLRSGSAAAAKRPFETMLSVPPIRGIWPFDGVW